jgi:hypothetical protein
MNNKDNKNFTRRDFSKLAMAGAISAALPGSLLAQKEPEQQGSQLLKKIK